MITTTHFLTLEFRLTTEEEHYIITNCKGTVPSAIVERLVNLGLIEFHFADGMKLTVLGQHLQSKLLKTTIIT